MKKLILTTVSLLSLLSWLGTSQAEEACKAVFTSKETWYSSSVMNLLEAQGIRMNALEKALEKCREQGFNLCVLRSSKINVHNGRTESGTSYTTMEVTLKGIDDLPLKGCQTYSGRSTWHTDSRADTLRSLGIKMDSLEDAIHNCEREGNDFCVVVSIRYASHNSYSYDRGRYATSAKAVVKGYKLDI